MGRTAFSHENKRTGIHYNLAPGRKDVNCLLCGFPAVLKEVGRKKEPYHFCFRCELIFKDPSLFPSKEEERKRYDQHNNNIADEGYRCFFRSFLDEALLPLVRFPCRVLDFGSGPSPVFGAILEDQGFQVSLYDPFYAPGEEVLSASYDLVTMTEVLEHLSRPREVLADVVSLLPSGGLLGIMTLKHDFNLPRFASWWYRQDITHLTFYSSRTFARIASDFHLELLFEDEKNKVVFRKK